MKTACAKWKDALLEAALSGTVASGLGDHLGGCASCAEALAALQTRRKQMDALLPLLANSAEPPAEFRARLLARVENLRGAKPVWRWRTRILAGATAAVLAVISVLYWRREAATRDVELAAAQRLADWRAPSDVLLETPTKEFLRAAPRLGESYVKVPIEMDKED